MFKVMTQVEQHFRDLHGRTIEIELEFLFDDGELRLLPARPMPRR